MRWMRHADELLEHLFSHRKVGDDTVLHRSNGADVARNTPKHLLGFSADGMNRSFTVRTSFLANGNDTRFVEDNSLATHINERVGCAEVNGNVVGEVVSKKAKHGLSDPEGSRRGAKNTGNSGFAESL